MKKALILTVVLFIIALFLQLLLFGTSPKIECSEINSQFYNLLQQSLYHYLILLVLQILFLKFWFKTDFKKSAVTVLLFTFLFLSIFSFFYYRYYNEICTYPK
ncbi:hypothetical protein C4F50_00230 [Flavobacterium sp. KB82]|uniref:Uncharacterized protein n=1 Tax=Flavobacterium hungaricum TaxID=2082725 RepID=A0ABR9TDL1_9FLAO|nr:hypothetical protein [Flavobacterium hungaricum]